MIRCRKCYEYIEGGFPDPKDYTRRYCVSTDAHIEHLYAPGTQLKAEELIVVVLCNKCYEWSVKRIQDYLGNYLPKKIPPHLGQA